MKHLISLTKILIYLLILGTYACTSNTRELTIDDPNGELSETQAPVSLNVPLNDALASAGDQASLGILDGSASGDENMIPAQLDETSGDGTSKIVLLMPGQKSGSSTFTLTKSAAPLDKVMTASRDSKTGQIQIKENGEQILQYNYETIYEEDVIRLEEAKEEQYTRTKEDTFVTVSRYAVPRSNYIHPLYGLEGEMLTRDWPEGGHPHHRGIFWAWPEVEFGSERADIYALQRVFARPTDEVQLTSGPVFAQIVAENLWMWEDSLPIVREHSVIRVYRATPESRVIDLTLKFTALKDSITIATRRTDSYGGLNLRMQTPDEQDISYHTDEAGSEPLRAWSDFNGLLEGANTKTGLMVLQHSSNPDYPGKWVEYPDLAWVQPTFPEPNTRYPLSKEKPLILRYRLITHKGGRPEQSISIQRWDAYHNKVAPDYSFIQEIN
ncbi:MAG: PmoA family protein [Bacteroidales bacterium]|nr:PmoA family protein [Bacteroidales bacterium]